jgi:hypothetical protein
MNFLDGVKFGLILPKLRKSFLKKTTIKMMRKKKYQKEYLRLFNGL